MDAVSNFFLAIGALIFAGILARVVYRRFKINDIIVLILLGIALGPFATNLVSPALFGGNLLLVGALALVMVLFGGGLDITYNELKEILGRVVGFAVLSYTLTACAAALIIYYLFPGLGWLQAIVMGAVLGGPGPSVFVPVFNMITIPQKLKRFLMLEGIISDSIQILLVSTLALLLPKNIAYEEIPKEFFILVAIAIVIGIVVGVIWKFVLSRYTDKFQYLLTLGTVFLTYAAGKYFDTSGLLAVYVLGIVIASSSSILMKVKIAEITKLQEELTFLLKIFVFIYIGLVLDLNKILAPSVVASALLVIAAMFLARFALMRIFRVEGAKEYFWATNAIFPRALATAVLTLTVVNAGIVTDPGLVNLAFAVVFLTNVVTSIAVFMHESKHRKPEEEKRKAEKIAMSLAPSEKNAAIMAGDAAIKPVQSPAKAGKKAKAPAKKTGFQKSRTVAEETGEAAANEVGPEEMGHVKWPAEFEGLRTTTRIAVEQIHNTMRAEMAFVLMLDADGKLDFFAGDEKTMKAFRGQGYKLLTDLGNEAMLEESKIELRDLGEVPNGEAQVDSIIILPIMRNERAVGAMGAINKRGGPYFEEEDANYLAVIKANFEASLE